MAWDSLEGVGSVTGTYVMLKPMGEAQLGWGGATGVIWEASFEREVRARADHGFPMHRLWETLERCLAAEGVTRVHNLGRNPALNESWYGSVLSDRGCQPVAEWAVAKTLSQNRQSAARPKLCWRA